MVKKTSAALPVIAERELSRGATEIRPDPHNMDAFDAATTDIGALIGAAKARMAERGPAEALPLWQQIRERFPNQTQGHLGYAEALMNAGRFDEADALLSETTDRFPDDCWGWIHYAQVAGRRGNWTEALQRWQLARDRFPEIPIANIGYGDALCEAGRFDASEKILSAACARFAEEPWAWIQRAKLATRRAQANRPYFEHLGPGDWQEPLRYWQEVRNRFPEISEGHLGYALALKSADRLPEAKTLLSEIVLKFPGEPWAWIHYAQTAADCADWTEALRGWREVGERFPVFAEKSYGGICRTAAAVQHQCNMLTHALPVSFEIQKRCLEFMRLIEPHSMIGYRKARFGSKYDGGYVMIDDFKGVTGAFSFGIANDANWDAAIADRGVPVFQFDHTIDEPPISRPDLIFTKARIAAEPGQHGQTQTIDELVSIHGSPGKATLLLKIDIEADEWPVFDSVSEEALACFAQIAAEFHYFGNAMLDSEFYQRALRVLQKLHRNFAVVHVHGINGHPVCNIVNVMVPDIMEITFANRRRYSFGPSVETFPGPLDAPCHPNMPDVHLGRFIY